MASFVLHRSHATGSVALPVGTSVRRAADADRIEIWGGAGLGGVHGAGEAGSRGLQQLSLRRHIGKAGAIELHGTDRQGSYGHRQARAAVPCGGCG